MLTLCILLLSVMYCGIRIIRIMHIVCCDYDVMVNKDFKKIKLSIVPWIIYFEKLFTARTVW